MDGSPIRLHSSNSFTKLRYSRINTPGTAIVRPTRPKDLNRSRPGNSGELDGEQVGMARIVREMP